MSTAQDINVGMTLYYKMKSGKRVFKLRVEEVSPNGRCIKTDDKDGVGSIWLSVDDIEVLDRTAS